MADTPFLDAQATFPWVRSLDEHWRAIRDEFDNMTGDLAHVPNIQDISVTNAEVTDDDRWKAIFLVGYGARVDANCARCPKTTELVEAVPGVSTAFFSILRPGKHIPVHRDPYKGLLNYHLGLRVPDPPDTCGIRVGGDVRHWEEGRSILFDATFPHEAWNESGDLRAVLFMSVARPLGQPAAAINEAVLKLIAHSPYVQDARRRQNAWDRTTAQR